MKKFIICVFAALLLCLPAGSTAAKAEQAYKIELTNVSVEKSEYSSLYILSAELTGLKQNIIAMGDLKFEYSKNGKNWLFLESIRLQSENIEGVINTWLSIRKDIPGEFIIRVNYVPSKDDNYTAGGFVYNHDFAPAKKSVLPWFFLGAGIIFAIGMAVLIFVTVKRRKANNTLKETQL